MWVNEATRPLLSYFAATGGPDADEELFGAFEDWADDEGQPVPSDRTVREAHRGLVRHRLIERDDASRFRVTDRGRAYLDGELSAVRLEGSATRN